MVVLSFGEPSKVRHRGCFWHCRQPSTVHKAYSSTYGERWDRCLAPRPAPQAPGYDNTSQLQSPEVQCGRFSRCLSILTVCSFSPWEMERAEHHTHRLWSTASFSYKLSMGWEGHCLHKLPEASVHLAVWPFPESYLLHLCPLSGDQPRGGTP